MTDILAEIGRLQKFYDEQTELNEKYLKQFELAGYEMNITETVTQVDTAFENTEVTEQGRPKTLPELIEEALGNPPSDPGMWIRIADIPNYIVDYLVVPDKQALDEFNSKANGRPQSEPKSTGSLDSYDDPEPVYNPLDDETKTYNDNGEPDPDFEKTGKTWVKAGLVPNNTVLVDSLGVLWKKLNKNEWAEVNSFDPDAPDYALDMDVSGGAPLYEVREK